MYRRGLLASCLGLIGTLYASRAWTQTQLDPENTLYLDLKQGRVVIQLLPDVAPKHVAQIKALAREGFYDGTPFHRVIDGFMAQGGDPTGTGTGGSKMPNLPPEFSQRHFVRGVCGMARSSDPGSANSQFFIMFAPAPSPGRQVHHLGHGGRAAWSTWTRSSTATARTGRCWVSRTASSICAWPRT